MVFIPLSFATSFFGMNLEQLNSGTINVGYFILVAFISGLVAWALAASIGPSERLWDRARNRYGEREFGTGDDYQWVTKTTIAWAWIRQRLSLAQRLYDLWLDEKNGCMDDHQEWFEERIPHFKRIVVWRCCKSIVHGAFKWLNLAVSLFFSSPSFVVVG